MSERKRSALETVEIPVHSQLNRTVVGN